MLREQMINLLSAGLTFSLLANGMQAVAIAAVVYLKR